MTIFGVGTDIVAVARIDAAWRRFGKRFPQRILSVAELDEFSRKSDPVKFLAKRFAAKEAFSKALGTGMRMPMAWRRMGVGHDRHGRPLIECDPRLAEYMLRRGVGASHISIADEHDHALAFVVLEAACEPQ